MSENRPVLHHREAFEEILQNYHVSDRARMVLESTPLVVLSGIAGGGRNTVIHRLVQDGKYEFIVSDTTRPPKLRDGSMEQHGMQYFFRSEQDFLNDLRAGEFIEAEVIHNQQVSGTSIREIERIAQSGKIPLGEVEYGGANAIADAKPDAVIIGLLPPSYDEWMRRLTAREAMSPEEFHNRLVTAEKVLANMLLRPFFHFVINETVESCAQSIDRIVHDPKSSDDATGREVARALLEKVIVALRQE